ncbi:excinuclease ABC subunit UvrA [Candidatus Parcubacteria bacterium]|nr:MAG: excinuclease ABC subunit UvrA [Candidatus Parcubacteria bacterium]
MPEDFITISGAREHNLKNISVKLPIDKFIVITGLSGSGKSSLAFDTLYAEGQRRYVESLSAYARQFLGLMNKPDVDSIKGLSPAISIEQKTVSKNPRSIVGTVTEIYDYLRLLYARIGIPHCPQCGKLILPQSAESIAENIVNLPAGTKVMVMASVIRGQKGTYEKMFKDFHKQGYSKIRVDGEISDLADWQKIILKKQVKHNIELIIDTLTIAKSSRNRLVESVETAMEAGDGIMIARINDKEEKIFSRANACTECGVSFEEIQPRMFSFNSPFGACPECHGLGISQKFDPDLIIPNKNLSLGEGAIKPWKTVGEGWRMQYIEGLAEHYGFDMYAAWKDLPANVKNIILYGTKDNIKFKVHSWERESTYSWKGGFEGIIPQMERLYRQTESEYRREDMEKFMRQAPCPACAGKRLKPESLAVTVDNKNIWELGEMSIGSLQKFFAELKLTKMQQEISHLLLKEVSSRLNFLINVGLDYLTLNREAGTLSGGEAQRIRLATQIGSELRGVMYILDEPSIGLHQRDNIKLIDTLKRLRDLGNTVLVVEHDAETILSSDYVVDLGPGAGIHGGKIVCEGTPKKILTCKNSLTADYLSGRKEIFVPKERRKAFDYLEVLGAREHNLKNIDVKIPLKVFTCITGVSGSGKSTLVNDILYKALYKIFWATTETSGSHRGLKGYGKLDKVVIVDQSPIGRTPRSNPATYIGVFTYIRELFSQVPEARARGYKPGRFSFNVAGGRCEECEGDGTIKIEMHFLPDVYVQCEKCKGTRYNRETLDVRYKGKDISQILEMTVEEALKFFKNIYKIQNKLQTLFDVGLGYIKLGQAATTLSGGEAQRIKLTAELSKKGEGNALYILDEPTTGLHFHDVKKLLEVLNRLVEKGNTVLVIEHNLDVIKSADWVIDLGPEGGERGGRIVAEGTPERIAKSWKWSYTGKYLKEVL